MVRLSEMAFFQRRLQRKINHCSRRIAQLTETIDGIEEEFWPEDYKEFCLMRRKYAMRRSDLIKKREGA